LHPSSRARSAPTYSAPRPMHALDQGQEPGVAGDESRGGNRLVAVTERSTIASETVALTFDTSETAVTALRAV
jgi:hypothetical protein